MVPTHKAPESRLCVCLLRTEEGEQGLRQGGARRVAEGQGEDGPGSVGDSGVTPIVV